MKRVRLASVLLGLSCLAMSSWGQWNPHTVLELNGEAGAISLPGQFQIVTEKMSRVVTGPYIVYMPEKDRLLMLVSYGYIYHAMVLLSDDHGATWSEPKFIRLDSQGEPDQFGGAASLTYLGRGKVLLVAGDRNPKGTPIWYSNDYGETWGNPSLTWVGGDLKEDPFWDPFLVDRDPKTGKVDRILASANVGDPLPLV